MTSFVVLLKLKTRNDRHRMKQRPASKPSLGRRILKNKEPNIVAGVIGTILASILLYFAGIALITALNETHQSSVGSWLLLLLAGGIGGLIYGTLSVTHIIYWFKDFRNSKVQ